MPNLRPLLSAVFRAVQHLSERRLHARRRSRAQRAVRRLGEIRSIVFICHGNICRSPYAAMAFQTRMPDRLADRMSVSSAGFIGPSRPPPPAAIRVAAARTIDMTGHRSAPLSADAVRAADIVLVMDTRQQRKLAGGYRVARDRIILLGDLDPEPVDARAIPDPILQPDSAFEACYSRIDRCVAELARLITEPPSGRP